MAAFLGTLRQRRWRHVAIAGLCGGLLLLGWIYWPRPA